MMLRRKSQAAMEFLMTYGWALLVVLIVIAALAFFGLLNPNRFLPEKCEIAPGVTCMDYNAMGNSQSCATAGGTEDCNITVLLNNGLGQTVNTAILNVTDCDNSAVATTMCGTAGTGAISAASCANHSAIGEGNTARFNINCSGMTTGAKFKSDMVFKYNVVVEGTTIDHTKSGYLVVEVERV